MANKITIVVNADGTAAIEGIERVGDSIRKISTQTAASGQVTKTTTEMIKTAWLEVYAKVELVKQAWDMAREFRKLAAEAEQSTRAFKMVADSFGMNADEMLHRWKKATHGMIDDSDLARQGMRGMLLGLKDDMDKITEMVRPAAVMSGQEPGQVLAALTTAFGAGVRSLGPLVAQYGLLTKETFQLLQEASNLGIDEASLVKVAYTEALIMGERLKLQQLDHLEQMHKTNAAIHEIKEGIGDLINKIILGLSSVFAVIGALVNDLMAEIMKPFDYLQRGVNWVGQQLGRNMTTNVWRDFREQSEAAANRGYAYAGRNFNLMMGNLPDDGRQNAEEQARREERIRDLTRQRDAMIKDLRSKVDAAKQKGPLRLEDDGTQALLAFQKQINALDPDLNDFQRRMQQLDDTFAELENRAKRAGWSEAVMQEIRDTLEKGRGFLTQKDINDQRELRRQISLIGKDGIERELSDLEKAQEDKIKQFRHSAAMIAEIEEGTARQRLLIQQKYQAQERQQALQELEARLNLQRTMSTLAQERGYVSALQGQIQGKDADIALQQKRIDNARELLQQNIANNESISERARLETELLVLETQMRGLAEERARLEERATGTMNQGMAEGWRKYFKDMGTQFDQGVEMARQTAQSMQQAFSDSFFSAMKGDLKSLGQAWTSFSEAVMRQISNLLAQKAMLGLFGEEGTGGLFASIFGSMFANGGIMTSAGPLPLHTYSGGGVANTPQVSIFAEGRRPEAYVPLPDGRSIPVTVTGRDAVQPQQAVHHHLHYNIQAWDSVDVERVLMQHKATVASAVMSAGGSNHPIRRGMR